MLLHPILIIDIRELPEGHLLAAEPGVSVLHTNLHLLKKVVELLLVRVQRIQFLSHLFLFLLYLV